jgi:hypothetical protein
MSPYLCAPGTGWPSYTPALSPSRKVKVILRPTVSRPVCLGVRHPSGTRDQFFFLLANFFRQLRVFYFVVPSLTRGRVCNLLLLLDLASAIPLGSESSRTEDHILLFSLPSNGRVLRNCSVVTAVCLHRSCFLVEVSQYI